MLPALKRDRPSLADVLPSSISAVGSSGAGGAAGAESNRLRLTAASRAVIVLVDGLGAAALKSRAGHARTLAGALSPGSVMDSGFPTTTAAALTSLATGTLPGQHGMVGYTVLDENNDRLVNQLSGWDDRIDPLTWQLQPTMFERATASGLEAVVVGAERYRNSGFTRAVLRGADYRAAGSIEARFAIARDWLREPGENGILYLYVPELDVAAHAHGWESEEWIRRLEEVDAAARDLIASLRPRDGLLVTADHGVLDVAARSHVLVDEYDGLVDGVRFVGGDPRCLQLYFEPDLAEGARQALIDRWRASESERAWVSTRAEAIDAGVFGEVDGRVHNRIGDLLVAARKNIAYYDGRSASAHGRAMVGQHGSLTPTEVQVPLLRFGAFTRKQ